MSGREKSGAALTVDPLTVSELVATLDRLIATCHDGIERLRSTGDGKQETARQAN